MYLEKDHIQTAPEGKPFGQVRDYKYRVMDRWGEFPIHHTNDIEDARWYFNKCRVIWVNTPG